MKPGEQVGEKMWEGKKNRLPVFYTFSLPLIIKADSKLR
jgi:hypothetical protein